MSGRALRVLAAVLALRCEVAQVVGAAPVCAPGAVEACALRGGCGACPAARRSCDAAGQWGACASAPRADVYRVCDGLHDEDCDGVCNLAERPCRCASRDEARACYDGPTGTLGVGRCRAGTQDCAAGSYGPCGGALEAPAAIERCGDDVDDDCDGATDEDCAGPRVLAVAAGDALSCALVRDWDARRLVCWGAGASGVFGDGLDRGRPVRVAGPDGVTALAMGASHLCVAAARGEVWCAGANDAGQLGDGTLDAAEGFVRVAGPSGVTAIAAGRRHTCALDAAGRAWCWGSDRVAQTGGDEGGLVACAHGGRGCRTRARAVAGAGAATSLHAGFEHTCARGGDGVRCWGEGAAFGATGAVEAPTAVFVGEAVDAVATGRRGTCRLAGAAGALRAGCLGDARGLVDGTFAGGVGALAAGAPWCAVVGRDLRCSSAAWGDEAPTGREGFLDALAYAPTGALTSLSVGLQHGCFVVSGRTVVCWGGAEATRHGQLGDPRTRESTAREVLW